MALHGNFWPFKIRVFALQGLAGQVCFARPYEIQALLLMARRPAPSRIDSLYIARLFAKSYNLLHKLQRQNTASANSMTFSRRFEVWTD